MWCWLTGRWPFWSDVLDMSATNGRISGKKSISTLICGRSSEHDFDGASMIVFCMSAIVKTSASWQRGQNCITIRNFSNSRDLFIKNPATVVQMDTSTPKIPFHCIQGLLGMISPNSANSSHTVKWIMIYYLTVFVRLVA